MAKSKAHEELIEAVVDYKRGLRNLKTGTEELVRISGLTPDVAAAFLKDMKRNSVTQIRGYSKEPERLRKGKEKAPSKRG